MSSQFDHEGSEITMVKASGYLKLTGGSYGKNQAPLSNKQGNNQSYMISESDDGTDMSRSNQEAESNQDIRSALTIISETEPGGSVQISQSDQENYTVSLRPEKGLDKLPTRRDPDSGVHVSGSDQGVIVLRSPEKPTVDGYNWRKYGQKLVRGNAFVRSYYKCTNANCTARKQIESSHDGCITEIKYLLKHEHPKPHTLQKQPSGFHERSSEIEPSEKIVKIADSHSGEIKSEVNNITPDIKRRKKESVSVNDRVVMKTNYEPRVVVETTSPVDIVHDGYRWRKYGQKQVKGSPNPRSYYRCVNAGCPVKKHVERATHDEKVVVTTYEGQHDHDMPAGIRMVTQNIQGNNNVSTSSDVEKSRPRLEVNESTGMELAVHVGGN
ncbi:WRKY transcription factor SUSIBA2-like [Rutidosis leptorrhynchoides]|uniref:WRKY transcription factor SUSIBA2-like n=1 Tax=Rutidosis leptorrhynchoides TaxID=125765 RepID=UPI003A995C18